MNCICNPRLSYAVVIAGVGVLFTTPAFGERSCAAVSTTAKPLSAKVRAQYGSSTPVMMVSGGGRGFLTGPDATQSSLQFEINAVLNSDGTVKGHASFVFPEAFAQIWGAVPGVTIVHLQGDLTTGSVRPDGKLVLSGPFVETDYSRGEGIVYQEDSRDSGQPPLRIEITPGTQSFTLSWCAFIPPNGTGVFSVEVTNGNLKVH